MSLVQPSESKFYNVASNAVICTHKHHFFSPQQHLPERAISRNSRPKIYPFQMNARASNCFTIHFLRRKFQSLPPASNHNKLQRRISPVLLNFVCSPMGCGSGVFAPRATCDFLPLTLSRPIRLVLSASLLYC